MSSRVAKNFFSTSSLFVKRKSVYEIVEQSEVETFASSASALFFFIRFYAARAIDERKVFFSMSS